MGRFSRTYLETGLGAVVVYLWLWILGSCFQSGNPLPLKYLPLLNPLELVEIFALIVIIKWAHRSLISDLPPYAIPSAVSAAAFILLNALIARSVHFLGGVPYTIRSLHDSILFQSSVSILWSLAALAIMVTSNRKGWREVWFAGSIILGLVVVKLFLVDLSGTGTVARIVSFIVVGVLMLVIGYFSPLPPRQMEENKI